MLMSSLTDCFVEGLWTQYPVSTVILGTACWQKVITMTVSAMMVTHALQLQAIGHTLVAMYFCGQGTFVSLQIHIIC